MTRRLNLTDAYLALQGLSKDFEFPCDWINRQGYVRFLDDLIASLLRSANHIGTENLEVIRQALKQAYKVGVLDGFEASKGPG